MNPVEIAGPPHSPSPRSESFSAPDALNVLARQIPPARLARLAATMADQARQKALTIEGPDGVTRPIPLALRPRLMTLEQRGYVHHLTWQMRLAMKQVAQLRRHSPDVQALLPLKPDEERWFQDYCVPEQGLDRCERMFLRFDAIARLGGPDWRDSIRLIEPNVVGIGGIRYSPVAEELLLTHIVPLYRELDPRLVCTGNDNVRELLWSELVDHARSLGVGDEPYVALMDDKSLYRGPGECGFLTAYFRSRGRRVVYADPRELKLVGGEVRAAGEKVDVIFRFLELGALSILEAKGEDLSAVRYAFSSGAVVPTAGGDIEHKGVLELFTSPVAAEGFTPTQQELFRRHVPWTRVVWERRTEGPDGAQVDLPEHIRLGRESLVLKLNRGAGGEGVFLGSETPQNLWEEALAQALAEPSSCVVQSECPADRQHYPMVGSDGSVSFQALYAVCGLFPSVGGVGVFGRVSSERVVNIHRGGGIAAFLVEVV